MTDISNAWPGNPASPIRFSTMRELDGRKWILTNLFDRDEPVGRCLERFEASAEIAFKRAQEKNTPKAKLLPKKGRKK